MPRTITITVHPQADWDTPHLTVRGGPMEMRGRWSSMLESLDTIFGKPLSAGRYKVHFFTKRPPKTPVRPVRLQTIHSCGHSSGSYRGTFINLPCEPVLQYIFRTKEDLHGKLSKFYVSINKARK